MIFSKFFILFQIFVFSISLSIDSKFLVHSNFSRFASKFLITFIFPLTKKRNLFSFKFRFFCLTQIPSFFNLNSLILFKSLHFLQIPSSILHLTSNPQSIHNQTHPHILKIPYPHTATLFHIQQKFKTGFAQARQGEFRTDCLLGACLVFHPFVAFCLPSRFGAPLLFWSLLKRGSPSFVFLLPFQNSFGSYWLG